MGQLDLFKINVECGIYDEEYVYGEDKNKFWPVLQPMPLPYKWQPAINRKYSVVFTSKLAVKFFSQWSFLSNAEYVCAVGKQTAELVQKKVNSPVLHPREEGLFNLLTETNFSHHSIVYIFTALNGKTPSTLKQISQQHPALQYEMLSVYSLETFKNNFLERLFLKEACTKNVQFIFNCYSGMVLTTVVKQLQTFFSCTSPCLLPSFIYFSARKQTVKNELQVLGLIDKIQA